MFKGTLKFQDMSQNLCKNFTLKLIIFSLYHYTENQSFNFN